MFLSRVQLRSNIGKNILFEIVKSLGNNSYGAHRLLWDLFKNGERFLFREEDTRTQLGTRRTLPLYYVLSNASPKIESSVFKIDVKPFAPQVSAGQKLMFRLRANPVVTRKTEGKKHSIRHDVLMDIQKSWLSKECEKRNLSISAKATKKELKKELLEHADFNKPQGEKYLNAELKREMDTAANNWLIRKGENCGFDISGNENKKELHTSNYRWHTLDKKNSKAGFSSIDYEGILEIREPTSFLTMLQSGLGPSKAFGCGLMLVRRV